MAVIRPSKLKKQPVDDDEVETGPLGGFDSIVELGEKIEQLAMEADKTRGKKEKEKLLTEAQRLADIYQAHCEAGGNHVKQFKRFI